MTLKPNYLRAVVVTYLWIGSFSLIGFAINRARGLPDDFDALTRFVMMGGAFMSVGASVMFVPRELTYDADGFSCRMIVQGSHDYTWDQLEAYGSGNAVLLLKFEGRQALQVSSFGFRRNEWKEFRTFLKQTFPKRRCWIWLGPIPLMRKR